MSRPQTSRRSWRLRLARARIGTRLLRGAALLAAALQPLHAQVLPAPARQAEAEAIVGIVHYTRWPEADSASRAAARYCVLAPMPPEPPEPPDAQSPLAQALLQANGGRAARVVAAPTPAALRDCDVVVIDGDWPADALRGVLRAFAQRPVLTVGFGGAFCSIGGSVCLQPGTQGTRFAINADALARSGLDIDPRALLLGRGHRRDAGSATEGSR